MACDTEGSEAIHLGMQEVKVMDEGQQAIKVKDYDTMEDGLNV
jgi:hypothetical protein